MTTPTLAAQHTERAFRRYEAHIANIVDRWPLLYTIDPSPLSVETFSCRIRDAMKSLRNNQWQTAISMGNFLQICDEVTVSTTAKPGYVCIGPYDAIRKKVPVGLEMESRTESTGIELQNPSGEVLKAVMLLHHHRILKEPTTVKHSTMKDVETLNTNNALDIAVEETEDGLTIF